MSKPINYLIELNNIQFLLDFSSLRTYFTRLQLFDLTKGFSYTGVHRGKITPFQMKTISTNPQQFFQINVQNSPYQIHSIIENNKESLVASEMTKEAILTKLDVVLRMFSRNQDKSSTKINLKPKKLLKKKERLLKKYQKLAIEQTQLQTKLKFAALQLKEIQSQQQENELDNLMNTVLKKQVPTENVPHTRVQTGWFTKFPQSHIIVSESQRTISNNQYTTRIPKAAVAYGSATMSGPHIFHIKIRVTLSTMNGSSNIGITIPDSEENAYVDGWVIDLGGSICCKKGNWTKVYTKGAKNGDVIGIILDLLNGKLGFKWNHEFLGWKFNNLNVNDSYVLAADLWNSSESFTIL
ncbi:spry domain containing socs box protein [Anaeramoeba flamelloides]|uniref:Spry domain containing socs box protein n=1 Tax=Anaeramoeba flamelloides TaxID=1746091 RepID=A0AAV8A1I4_9EUKA|nr:spry domain containing socs box protein [Anaeramoeba flamelloides]